MYPKMRIAGSLVHHFLICSLVVCYAMVTILFIAYQAFGNVLWFKLAYGLDLVAAAGALIAVIGYLSWTSKPEEARPAGSRYLIFSLVSLILFAAQLYLLSGQLRHVTPDAGYAVVFCAAGFLSYIFATFTGWGLPEIKSEARPAETPKADAGSMNKEKRPIANPIKAATPGFNSRTGLAHS